MTEKRILDVREIDKNFRKKIILGMFAELLDGQYLELTSDHSLAPLQKLFQKEKHGFFKWKEVESGPDEWKTTIKISLSSQLVTQIIWQNF